MNLVYSVPPSKGGKAVKGPCPGLLYAPKNEVAFIGKLQVVASPDEFYGEGSKGYLGPVLENPTWGKLFAEAKKQARCTKDYSHIYFEGFRLAPGAWLKDGVYRVNLFMGS
jgi:hypothetical protein